jgi:ABC-type transporter Mla MlaB component
LTAPEESPTTLVFVVGGPITRAGIPELCERVGAILEMNDAGRVVCDVGALTGADAVTVDALARLQLTARRLGRRIALRYAGDDLQSLLGFMGLSDVVPLCVELALEPGGQSEEREQGRGVEEEDDPVDPPG